MRESNIHDHFGRKLASDKTVFVIFLGTEFISFYFKFNNYFISINQLILSDFERFSVWDN